MGRRTRKLRILPLWLVLTVLVPLLSSIRVCADSSWGGREPRGPAVYGQRTTTAHISQGLYGDSIEPYDVPEDPPAEEASKTLQDE